MARLFTLIAVLLIISFQTVHANVYASGIRISDDTVSVYSSADNSWDGNFANGGVKIWYVVNENGGGTLTGEVRIKQGATLVKTLAVNPVKGINSVVWNGTNSSDAPAGNGPFTFEIVVNDPVGHAAFDSLWVAGANKGGTDWDGLTTFGYRGNASITDQSSENYGYIYVARGSTQTATNNGFYELLADGSYNGKLSSAGTWANSTPNEVTTLGSNVYGVAGYGYTGGGYIKGYNTVDGSLTGTAIMGSTNLRAIYIKVSGTDTLYYTARSGTGTNPAIIRTTGLKNDTTTYINLRPYIAGTNSYVKSFVFDDAGNCYVAYGEASASRKALSKFDAAGVLVWTKKLDTDYLLNASSIFQALALHTGSTSAVDDDKMYALIHSPTAGEWGIYSVALDGSAITKLVSPAGGSSAATSQIINVDPIGNVIWSNGSANERIISFSPAAGPNSYTTVCPKAAEIVIPFEGTKYVGAAGTKPGGGDPQYATLKDAVTALNAATLTGDVTFLITSDLNEADHSGIGLDTRGYTATFKPAPGVSPVITFTKTTDNTGLSGGLVIGTPNLTISSANNYGCVPTRNIVIDGSNTVGGTTRDMTIRTSATSNGNTNPIRILGDVSNVIIKNVVVLAQQSVSYGVLISNRSWTPTGGTQQSFTPDSILIENCDVTNIVGGAGQAIAIVASQTPSTSAITSFPKGIVISKNKVTAKHRGIFLNSAGDTDILGNEVYVNQTGPGMASYGIWALGVGDTLSVLNIKNNQIKQLQTANANAGDYGITGIAVSSKGIYHVYNNMVSGFSTTSAAATVSFRLHGIRVNSATAKAELFNNSIYLPQVTYTAGSGSQQYAGIAITDGKVSLKNNVIVSDVTADTSFGIHRSGTNGTVESDYNDIYTTADGFTGFWGTAPAKTLDDWRLAAGLDAHSISVNPGFTSASDLHLANTQSPVIGQGIEIPTLTTDIDGDTRDVPPEMGADDLPGVVPVELVSLKATSNGNVVTLSWRTITETNNSRFDIERKIDGQNWATVGSVSGKGTTSEVTDYRYTDQVSGYSKLSYRLKQVDLDGTFSYSKVVELTGTATPKEFALSQNYPNPFNPTTKISYTIPVDSRVNLAVYSITGELVTELVNSDQAAGVHTVEFNATNLANGIYIYKIQAGSFVQTRKMMLVK